MVAAYTCYKADLIQDSHMKLPQRLFQMLVDTFEDSMGIDYERMYMAMVEAQSRTGLCRSETATNVQR